MISPRFATMLCFVETDAALSAETADLLLGVCVKRSFDRASVDGQLSTNDTAILMCSGASGVEIAPESEDELRFGEALDALLRALAIMMVADGEGAGRSARVIVRGGEARRRRGWPRARSPTRRSSRRRSRRRPQLGADRAGGRRRARRAPRLPRAAGARRRRSRASRCAPAGAAIPYDEPALARAVQREEVEYEVTLPGTIGAETEVFFSDLSHEYVSVNAEYTT